MNANDAPKPRQIKLSDREWEALAEIARHHGKLWGGIENRAAAVRLMIERELERIRCEPGNTTPAL